MKWLLIKLLGFNAKSVWPRPPLVLSLSSSFPSRLICLSYSLPLSIYLWPWSLALTWPLSPQLTMLQLKQNIVSVLKGLPCNRQGIKNNSLPSINQSANPCTVKKKGWALKCTKIKLETETRHVKLGCGSTLSLNRQETGLNYSEVLGSEEGCNVSWRGRSPQKGNYCSKWKNRFIFFYVLCMTNLRQKCKIQSHIFILLASQQLCLS